MNAADTTQALVRLWAEHRSEGIRRGITWRHDWETAPDWAHKEADEWVAKDAAFRLLIGTRLADAALTEFEGDA